MGRKLGRGRALLLCLSFYSFFSLFFHACSAPSSKKSGVAAFGFSEDQKSVFDVEEDGKLTIALSIDNPSGGDIEFSKPKISPISTDDEDAGNPRVTVTSADETISATFRPDNFQSGTYRIVFEAVRKKSNESSKFTCTLRVKNKNQAPISIKPPEKTALVISPGTTQIISLDLIAEEGDHGKFRIVSVDPSGKFLDLSNKEAGKGLLTISPSRGDAGKTFTATIIAEDGDDASETITLKIDVPKQNDLPVLRGIEGDIEVAVGETRDIPIEATDAEGDSVTLSLTNALPKQKTSWISVSALKDGVATLHIKAPTDACGEYPFVLEATDALVHDAPALANAKNRVAFSLRVRSLPPLFTSSAFQKEYKLFPFQTLRLPAAVEDPDAPNGDEISLDITSKEGLEPTEGPIDDTTTKTAFQVERVAQGESKLLVRPVETDAGKTLRFTAVVQDACGLKAERSFAVKVAKNNRPVIDVNSAERRDIADTPVKFTEDFKRNKFASIGEAETLVLAFKISDADPKDVPGLQTHLQFRPEGSTVWSDVSPDSGVDFDETKKIFRFTPAHTLVSRKTGIANLNFRLLTSDHPDLFTSYPFTVAVEDTNAPPRFDNLANVGAVNFGDPAYAQTIALVDDDGDAIALEIAQASLDEQLDDGSHKTTEYPKIADVFGKLLKKSDDKGSKWVFSFAPLQGKHHKGTYNFVLKATDAPKDSNIAKRSTLATLELSLTNNPRPPKVAISTISVNGKLVYDAGDASAELPTPLSLKEQNILQIAYSAEDPNATGGAIAFLGDNLPANASISPGGILSFTPAFTQQNAKDSDVYSLSVKAKDETGLTSTVNTFAVHVENVNRRPIFKQIGSVTLEDTYVTQEADQADELLGRYVVNREELFALAFNAVDLDGDQLFYSVPPNDPINAKWKNLPQFSKDVTGLLEYTPERKDSGKEFAFRIRIADVSGDQAAESEHSSLVTIRIFVNNLSFLSFPRFQGVHLGTRIASADINGDAIPDLAVANSATGTASIYKNIAPGEKLLAPVETVELGSSGAPITGFCANHFSESTTGASDLAFSSGDIAYVLINNGKGTFGEAEPIAISSAARSMACGNVNDDEFADIIALNPASQALSVWINNGDGTFLEFPDVAYLGFATGEISAADEDGDGLIDRVAALHPQDDAFSSYTITRSAVEIPEDNPIALGEDDFVSFAPLDSYVQTGDVPRDVRMADLDLDGLLDIVISNAGDNTVSVYKSLDIGGYTPTAYPVGKFPTALTLADVDADPYWMPHSSVSAARFMGANSDAIVVGSKKGLSTFDRNTNVFTSPSAQFCPSLARRTTSIDFYSEAGTRYTLIGAERGACLITEADGNPTLYTAITVLYDHDNALGTPNVRLSDRINAVRFAGSGKALLIATDDGLAYSSDGGVSYKVFRDKGDKTIFSSNDITAVDAMATQTSSGPGTAWIVGTKLGVYLSSNTGGSFTKILADSTNNLRSNVITRTVFFKGDLTGATFIVGTEKGLFKTDTRGASFTRLPLLADDRVVAIALLEGSTVATSHLLVATAAGPKGEATYVQSSSDGGASFTTLQLAQSLGFPLASYTLTGVDYDLSDPTGSTFLLASNAGLHLHLPDGFVHYSAKRHLDIAVTNQLGGTVSVLQNDGHGGFGVKRPLNLMGGQSPAAIIGFDVRSSATGLDKSDLAVVDIKQNELILLLNEASGVFPTAANASTGIGPKDIVIADMDDSDGVNDWDLVVANSSSEDEGPYLSLLANRGDRTYNHFKIDWRCSRDPGNPAIKVPCQSGINGIAVEDFDKNSKMDVVATSTASNTVSIIRDLGIHFDLSAPTSPDGVQLVQDGVQNFPADLRGGTTPLGLSPTKVKAADINGDSWPDIAVLYEETQKVAIYWNRSGVFSESDRSDIFAGLSTYPVDFYIGDLRGDNRFDLAMLCSNTNQIQIYEHTNTGFAEQPNAILDTGSFPTGMAGGQLNGATDSFNDLVVTNSNDNKIQVFLNGKNGVKGSFGDPSSLNTKSYPASVIVADLDPGNTTDGIPNGPDILVTNREDASVSVFINQASKGQFVRFIDLFVGHNPVAVAVRDIDNDGIMKENVADSRFDLDIIAANEFSNNVSILYNLEILDDFFEDSEDSTQTKHLSLISNSHESSTAGQTIKMKQQEFLQLKFRIQGKQEGENLSVIVEHDGGGGTWEKKLPTIALFKEAKLEFTLDLINQYNAICSADDTESFRFSLYDERGALLDQVRYSVVIAAVNRLPQLFTQTLPSVAVGAAPQDIAIAPVDVDLCGPVTVNATIPSANQTLISFDKTLGILRVGTPAAGDIGNIELAFELCEAGGTCVDTTTTLPVVAAIPAAPIISVTSNSVAVQPGQRIELDRGRDLSLQVSIAGSSKLVACDADLPMGGFNPTCNGTSATLATQFSLRFLDYRKLLANNTDYPVQLFARDENGRTSTFLLYLSIRKPENASPYLVQINQDITSPITTQVGSFVDLDLTFTDDENDLLLYTCKLTDTGSGLFLPCANFARLAISPAVFSKTVPGNDRSFNMLLTPALADVGKEYLIEIGINDSKNPVVTVPITLRVENTPPSIATTILTGQVARAIAGGKEIDFFAGTTLKASFAISDKETPTINAGTVLCRRTLPDGTIETCPSTIFAQPGPTATLDVSYDKAYISKSVSYEITYTDGNGLNGSQILRLNYKNSAPKITMVLAPDATDHDHSSATVNLGETYSIDISISDVDAQRMALGCLESAADLAPQDISADAFFSPCRIAHLNSVAVTNGVNASHISFTPQKEDQLRTYYLYFRAQDEEGAISYEKIALRLTKANKPPVIISESCNLLSTNGLYKLTEADPTTVLTCSLYATDANQDSFTFDGTGLPANVVLDPLKGNFTFTPDYNQAGQYSFMFKATDAKGSVSELFVVEVDVADKNRRPLVVNFDGNPIKDDVNTSVVEGADAIPKSVLKAGQTKKWVLVFRDPDANDVTCTTAPGATPPKNLTINKGGSDCVISLLASPLDRGKRFPLPLVISDGKDSSTMSFTIAVSSVEFDVAPPLALDSEPGELLVVDVNDDAKDDLIIAPLSIPGFRLLLNQTPNLPTHITKSVDNQALATHTCAADFDGDGLSDLAFATNANDLGIVFNSSTSPGNYQSALTTYPVGKEIADLRCGDFGEDRTSNGTLERKDVDIWILERDSSAPKLRVFLNNGVGTMASQKTIALTGRPQALALQDFDGDHLVDIAAIINATTASIDLFRISNGTLSTVGTSLKTGTGPTALLFSNLDAKYVADLLVTNASDNKLQIYYSQNAFEADNAAATYSDATGDSAKNTTVATKLFPTKLFAADFDGNFLPDISVLNQLENVVSVYPNAGTGPDPKGQPIYLSGGEKLADIAPLFIEPLSVSLRPDVAVLDSQNRNAIFHKNEQSPGYTISGPKDVADMIALDVSSATPTLALGGKDGLTFLTTTAPKGQRTVKTAKTQAIIDAQSGPLHVHEICAQDFNGDGSDDLAFWAASVPVAPTDPIEIKLGLLQSNGGALSVIDGALSIVDVPLAEDDSPADILCTKVAGQPTVYVMSGNGDDVHVFSYAGGAVSLVNSVSLSTGGTLVQQGAGAIAAITNSSGNAVMLAIIQQGIAKLTLLTPNGTNLSTLTKISLPGFPTAVETLLLAGDQIQDIAVSSVGEFGTEDRLSIFRAQNSSYDTATFTTEKRIFIQKGTDRLVPLDLQGDGRFDLAVANSSEGFIEVIVDSSTDRYFHTDPVKLSYGGVTDIASFSSTRFDIAILNAEQQRIVFAGTGQSSPFPSTKKLDAGNVPNSIVSADFNGDGTLDFAVGNADAECTTSSDGQTTCAYAMSFLAQQSDRTYTRVLRTGVEKSPFSLQTGKFSRKSEALATRYSYQDLAYINADTFELTFLFNDITSDISANFGRTGHYPAKYPLEALVTGDLDNDGDDDVVGLGGFHGSFTMFENGQRQTVTDISGEASNFSDVDYWHDDVYANTFAISSNAGVAATYDGGKTYALYDATTSGKTNVTRVLPSSTVSSLRLAQEDPTSFLVATNQGAAFVHEKGQLTDFFSLPNIEITAVDYLRSDLTKKTFIVGTKQGAYVTSDGGVSFTPVSALPGAIPLPSELIRDVRLIDANTFVIATASGVWVRRVSGGTVQCSIYQRGDDIVSFDYWPDDTSTALVDEARLIIATSQRVSLIDDFSATAAAFGDGALDDGEVDGEVVSCNESASLKAIMTVEGSADTSICSSDGYKITAGVDNGDGYRNNGILDAAEEDPVSLEHCIGSNFRELVRFEGTTTGARIAKGFDNGDGSGTIANGILESGEIDGTPTSVSVFQRLERTTSIAAGGVCGAVTGFLRESGLDDGKNAANNPSGTAGDGVLQAGEVETSTSTCAKMYAAYTGNYAFVGLPCGSGKHGVEYREGFDDGSGAGTADNGKIETGEATVKNSLHCEGDKGSESDGFYHSYTWDGFDVINTWGYNWDNDANFPEAAEDIDNDGRLDVKEDLDNDTRLDVSEDVDLDGRLDVSEDANNNGILDPGEDLDSDTRLDVKEDKDNDSRLDVKEDKDNDGRLDIKEDLNNNGTLDSAEQVGQSALPVNSFRSGEFRGGISTTTAFTANLVNTKGTLSAFLTKPANALTTVPTIISCASGGIVANAQGFDDGQGGGTAGNNQLEIGELDTSADFVCAGVSETSLSNLLFKRTFISAGATCASGGQQIDMGFDANANGALDSAEITTVGTTTVCTSSNAEKMRLRAVVPTTGTCPYGGLLYEVGVDDNSSNALDDAEVDRATYFCGGTNSRGYANTWIEHVVTAKAGACLNGGIGYETAADNTAGTGGSINDGALVNGEGLYTSSTCFGTTASGSLLTKVTSITDPQKCGGMGGAATILGNDDGLSASVVLPGGGNGVLDPLEIDNTKYACHASSTVHMIVDNPPVALPTADDNRCSTGGLRVQYGLDNGDAAASFSIPNLSAADISKVAFIGQNSGGSRVVIGGKTGIILYSNVDSANSRPSYYNLPSSAVTDADFIKFTAPYPAPPATATVTNAIWYRHFIGTKDKGAMLLTEVYRPGSGELLDTSSLFINSTTHSGVSDKVTSVKLCPDGAAKNFDFMLLGTQDGVFISTNAGTNFGAYGLSLGSTGITTMDCQAIANKKVKTLFGTTSGAVATTFERSGTSFAVAKQQVVRNGKTVEEPITRQILAVSSYIPSDRMTSLRIARDDTNAAGYLIGTDKGIALTSDDGDTFTAYNLPTNDIAEIIYDQADATQQTFALILNVNGSGARDAFATTYDGGRSFTYVHLDDWASNSSLVVNGGDKITSFDFHQSSAGCVDESGKVRAARDYQILGTTSSGVRFTTDNWAKKIVGVKRIAGVAKSIAGDTINSVRWISSLSTCNAYFAGVGNTLQVTTDGFTFNDALVAASAILRISDDPGQSKADALKLKDGESVNFIALLPDGIVTRRLLYDPNPRAEVLTITASQVAADFGSTPTFSDMDVLHSPSFGSVIAVASNRGVGMSNTSGNRFTVLTGSNTLITDKGGSIPNNTISKVHIFKSDRSGKKFAFTSNGRLFLGSDLTYLFPYSSTVPFNLTEIDTKGETTSSFDLFDRGLTPEHYLVGSGNGLYVIDQVKPSVFTYNRLVSYNLEDFAGTSGGLGLTNAPTITSCAMATVNNFSCGMVDLSSDVVGETHGLLRASQNAQAQLDFAMLPISTSTMPTNSGGYAKRVAMPYQLRTELLIADEAGVALYRRTANPEMTPTRVFSVPTTTGDPSGDITALAFASYDNTDTSQGASEFIIGTKTGLQIVNNFSVTQMNPLVTASTARQFSGDETLKGNGLDDAVVGLAVDPAQRNVFAYITGRGLFETSDNASTFRLHQKGAGFPENFTLNDLSVEFSGGKVNKYVGTGDGYFSIKGDALTHVVPEVFPTPEISAITSFPGSDSLLIGSTKGLAQVVDIGGNKSGYRRFLQKPTSSLSFDASADVRNIAVSESQNPEVFTLAAPKWLAYTTDGGFSFVAKTPAVSEDVSCVRMGKDGEIFAGLQQTLWYSIDSGATWIAKSITSDTAEHITDLAVSKDKGTTKLLIATDKGLYRLDSLSGSARAIDDGAVASYTSVDFLSQRSEIWLAGTTATGALHNIRDLSTDAVIDPLRVMKRGISNDLPSDVIEKVTFHRKDPSGRSLFALTSQGLYIERFMYSDDTRHVFLGQQQFTKHGIVANILRDASDDAIKRNDIVTLNRLSGSIFIYRNTGAFVFGEPNTSGSEQTRKPTVELVAGPSISSVAAGDLNNDGYVDLVVSDDQENNLRLYYFDPATSSAATNTYVFKDPVIFSTGRNPSHITLADLNPLQCGASTIPCSYPEILVANEGDHTLSVFANDFGTEFYENLSLNVFVGIQPIKILSGDMDNDGFVSSDGVYDNLDNFGQTGAEIADIDIVVLNQGSNDVALLYDLSDE